MKGQFSLKVCVSRLTMLLWLMIHLRIYGATQITLGRFKTKMGKMLYRQRRGVVLIKIPCMTFSKITKNILLEYKIKLR